VRRFRHVLRRCGLAAEASLWLTLAALVFTLLPSSRTIGLLGCRRHGGVLAPPSPGVLLQAARIGRAVELVAGLLPWHPVCLSQAVAVRVMLRCRGIACETHLGMIGTDPARAHAWVTIDGVVLQGAIDEPITPLASFC